MIKNILKVAAIIGCFVVAGIMFIPDVHTERVTIVSSDCGVTTVETMDGEQYWMYMPDTTQIEAIATFENGVLVNLD